MINTINSIPVKITTFTKKALVYILKKILLPIITKAHLAELLGLRQQVGAFMRPYS